MIRVRKLVLAIAAASALSSGMAQALGLGEVTLRSALNQPLVADIELLEARDLGNQEVLPKLASPDAFTKAGVERAYFLTDLKFTPVIKPNGKSIIRVTSSQPVREPYLNFLVEVLWPNGRALREYTLLLDPPLYSPQAAAAAAPRAPVTGLQQPAETRTAKAYASMPAASAPTPVAPAPARESSAYRGPAAEPTQTPKVSAETAGVYKTSSADTLWQIAERTPGNGSAHQKMLAIQDLNPDAFIDGNINRLKRGQVLRLPDDQQINSRTQPQAIAEVRQQNTAWRAGTTAAADPRQLDATKRNAAGAAPAEIKEDDNLKLVSAETGKATAGADTGKVDTKVLSNKLAVTEESLDSTRRENEELQSRMGDLQSQLDKLQRLIQLKDSQLAKLQAELGEDGTAAAAAGVAGAAAGAAADNAAAGASPSNESGTDASGSSPAGDVAADPAAGEPVAANAAAAGAAPADALAGAESADANAAAGTETADTASANATAADAAAGGPAAGDPASPQAQATQAPAETDYNYSEEPESDETQPVVADSAAAPAPAPATTEPTPAPTPADAPAEESALDSLMANPMLLGATAGGALLLLLLALMAVSRRNAAKEAAAQEELAGDYNFENDVELPAGSLDEQDADTAVTAHEAGEEPVTAKTADVLSEADIYIAYGRFNQAAELLVNAINDEPQRADLRLKLMEVYAEMGDREGFVRQESELLDFGGSAAEIDQLKARYPAMVVAGGAAMLMAADSAALDDAENFNLDDLSIDDEPQAPQAAPVQSAAPAEDDAFDFDLDDLEDLDAPTPAPAQPTVESTTETHADSDLAGFEDLQLDEQLSEEPVTLTDELDDFNFDFAADEPQTPAATPVAEDEFLLDFEDELSEDTTAITPKAEETAEFDTLDLPADFDLSLDETISAEDKPEAAAESFEVKLEDVSGELEQLSDSLAENQPEEIDLPDVPEVTAESLAAEDFDGEDDFDFLSGTDETATKLDLARAYIDMGDAEGAKDILDEVIAEGNDGQQQEAKELIAKLV
ncbi:Motility hub protein FimV [Pseudomonas marincola]|uniref:FimV N-terminal domain-containing protein n=1 Tax=Pseudomonas marincola TaxID=437900 RepID=A0A653EA32_9PSED|nr:FimV/HubP family polar landmark protein [Pseudomonas marincola]CAE6928685.1 Motility hub protein FimV [Pseudomonas marincola]